MQQNKLIIKEKKRDSLINSLKHLVKSSLKYNLIDSLADWTFDQFKALGIMETFEHFYYWVLGWNNFHQIFKTVWRYTYEGVENFPEYGPAIMISNHQSELDPFIVGTPVHRKIHWISKKENFDIPIFKSIIKPFGTIALKRGQNDQKAMDTIKAILEDGGVVGMFPEGTRSSDGKLAKKFRSGAARLCIELGVPYVPAVIIGAEKILPKHKDWTHTKLSLPIHIRIGPPVYVDPSIELNYENARLVAIEMRNDVLRLQKGYQVKERTISIADLEKLKRLEKGDLSIDQLIEADESFSADYSVTLKDKIKNSTTFDPAVDYNIS